MAAIKTWFSRYRSCEHWSPRLAPPSPSVRPSVGVAGGLRGRTPSKARGAGGPFVPRPRSGTEARGPGAQRRAETWGQRFWLLLSGARSRDWQK